MTSILRPRVFIGSSTEHLHLAEALQRRLGDAVESTVWDQETFRVSGYPMEALRERLEGSDFGVFVAAPSDRGIIRGDAVTMPRDNVIFEIGLFMGYLGRERTFLVVPKDDPTFRLPTDILALTVATYEIARRDRNVDAALGPAASKIRGLIQERSASRATHAGITRTGLFPEFDDRFAELLVTVHEQVTLFFLHSRRWREGHRDALVSALRRKVKLEVFLPELLDAKMLRLICAHFPDEMHIPGLISEAYSDFAKLKNEFKGLVHIRAFDGYPVYSAYGFDDQLVVALYPNAPWKRHVPTFEVREGAWSDFVNADLDHLRKHHSRLCNMAGCRKRAAMFTTLPR